MVVNDLGPNFEGIALYNATAAKTNNHTKKNTTPSPKKWININATQNNTPYTATHKQNALFTITKGKEEKHFTFNNKYNPEQTQPTTLHPRDPL